MNPELKRETIIFVLRIWCEHLNHDESVFRGELEDLTGQKKWAFSGADALERLVREHYQPDPDQVGR